MRTDRLPRVTLVSLGAFAVGSAASWNGAAAGVPGALAFALDPAALD